MARDVRSVLPEADLRTRPVLPEHGRIGIVAPASGLSEESIGTTVTYLELRGHPVVFSGNVGQRTRFTAGPDDARAAALMHAFSDDGIDAVFSARGGYGSGRLLSLLDYDSIAANPKPFVGFSDTTALQLALLARARLPSFTGMSCFPELRHGCLDPLLESTVWPMLYGRPIEVSAPLTLRGGSAAGPVVAGCLSMLVSLLGTPFLPDLRGCILVLEDVNEEPYRIDRLLVQLRHAGVLDRIAALVFGTFLRCEPKDPADGTVEEVLLETAGGLRCPVVSGLPYGHPVQRCAMPVGLPGRLIAGARGARLTVF